MLKGKRSIYSSEWLGSGVAGWGKQTVLNRDRERDRIGLLFFVFVSNRFDESKFALFWIILELYELNALHCKQINNHETGVTGVDIAVI